LHKLAWLLGFACLALLPHADAQSPKLHRIGVIHSGGAFEAALRGMVVGLKDVGLVEGKHYVLHVRDTRGSPREVETAAKQLASERVDVLFTVTTSVTMAARKATQDVRIVFALGSDPVRFGLVKSYAQPGERLTGVQQQSFDLVAKRMEILKQVLPDARRLLVIYNPESPVTPPSLANARAAAAKLKVELIERTIGSVDEAINLIRTLPPGYADACFQVTNATVFNGLPRIIAAAHERKMPVIVSDLPLVDAGALVAYGGNYFEVGRLAAKHVQRVLAGARPGDIPIEIYDQVQLGVNLRVAKELGIAVPQPVVLRADKVIR
jgi:putative ABC transport system substrate-binding protein